MLREGFCEVIPADLLTIFNSCDLEALISGIDEINID